MTGFDKILALDWSGAKASYGGIAVAEADTRTKQVRLIPPNGARWRREAVFAYLSDRIEAGERLLITIDCAFSMPFQEKGYLLGDAGPIQDAYSLWQVVEDAAAGAPDFGVGPLLDDPCFQRCYWTKGTQPPDWIHQKRRTEIVCGELTRTYPMSVFKLIGAKQVGKASLTGMRMMAALSRRFGEQISTWPFDPPTGQTVFAEIYPTLFRQKSGVGTKKLTDPKVLAKAVKKFGCGLASLSTMNDHEGDALITAAGLVELFATTADPLPWPVPAQVRKEGWIVGVPL